MSNNALALIEMADQLEDFIRAVIPNVEKVSKYGGVLFTLRPDEKEGQFCGVFIYSQHVQLSFSKGALLNDPDGLLKGNGKQRRHINFKTIQNADFEYLKALLIESSKL